MEPTTEVLVHLMLDLLFCIMTIFVGVCHQYPEWVAKKQSNPYTLQLPWNLGPNSFNFQVLNYELYHLSFIARWSHHVTIALEAFLWMLVIRGMFGITFSILVLSLLSIQAFSFRDSPFAVILISLWTILAITSEVILYVQPDILFLSKHLIFWSVIVRTSSHVMEPVPPIVNQEKSLIFGAIGFQFALTHPLEAAYAFLFGVVSEMSSGLPGRLFPVLVYVVLNHLGYQSENLMTIRDSHQIRSSILRGGWKAYPVTEKLFSWVKEKPAA